ncbi:hypothetical protein A3844_00540 [Paenibacillus helianthi]|uniref:Ig-like domain-containing protein n=1 Tax=Paenibacillus helianthi TaxID=1349432 RepID=A0ABX3EY21_9BACL|nr:hypothetical protein [Paenibacillus helianthi]OKP91650.1 hypothetical protein A3844_00540 [Paenibacillus helianthi]
MRTWAKKSLTTVLAAVMLSAGMPWPGQQVNAAGSYEDVYVSGTKLLHNGDWYPERTSDYDEDTESDALLVNAFGWFSKVQNGNVVPGVTIDKVDGDLDGGPHLGDADVLNATIRIADNPQLKQLAEGEGQFRVYIRSLYESDDDSAEVEVHSKNLGRWYREDYVGAGPNRDDQTTDWVDLEPDDVITIHLESWGSGTVTGIHLNFRDVIAPTVKDYIFDTTGTQRDNTTIDEKELLVKWGDEVNLTYPFSEPLKASSGEAADLMRHDLFTNPSGTGLPADGENQGMQLPAATSWAQFTDKLSYTYKAANYQHTGNLPIVNGGEISTLPSGINLNEKSLKQKVIDADFHDAAGNPLIVSNFGQRASAAAGDTFLRGKAINPFDATADPGNASDGFRVIVDAVPPKYSFTANGIQPDIVTGSTLNKGDTLEFKVRLTEDVIAKKGLSADGLFLYFNNGMKAYYVEGENSSLWTFRAAVTEDDLDVALLKVIALTHSSRAGDRPAYADKGVLQDYAGNLLTDPVNTSKSAAPAPTDPSLQVPNTKIDWAKLSIDNTDPSFKYLYDTPGATGNSWARSGKITIDARDPQVIAPPLDPDEAGQPRPSRGIYRPLNMTGSSGESANLGLVYYYWSQSPDDPLAGKEADEFAAVKRYSLTGQQPREGLYTGELDDFNLMVANNSTNLLSPPAKALMAEGSGTWYLHTWTADMTWDSARELMQYEKMKTYKSSHAASYNGWINEYKATHTGASEADAETYANGKALEAVGDYGDLSLWTAADFKHDDSNWIYGKTAILLDNKAPVLGASISGINHTAVVKATVGASDEHSGIDPASLQFQWVKVGETPGELDWHVVPSDRSVTTLNNVVEDGEYILYLRTSDRAGNTAEFQMVEHVVVDSAREVSIAFTPEAPESYIRSQDIEVTARGAAVLELQYVFSPSAVRPAESLYRTTAMESVYKDVSVTDSVYRGVVQAVYGLNGEQYLHIRLKEDGNVRYYDYSTLYRFDNAAPEITFSLNGVSYPRSAYSVLVTSNELYNPSGTVVEYQWLPENAAPPEESSGGWLPLPEDGKAVLDSSQLAPGQSAGYVLYVYARDGLGNSAVTHTGTFRLYRADTSPVEVLQSDLVAFESGSGQGSKAILQLELKSVSKDGFEYSVSSDNGTTWGLWRPYTNFVQVAVQQTSTDQLQLKAKFRSPSGVESTPVSIDTSHFDATADPLYGLAAYSTLRPTKSGGISLSIAVATGIKVTPAADNPALAERVKGNTFKISQNGLYTFNLVDLTAPERKTQLLAVVSNIDLTPPVGLVEYNITGPTRGNVTAKLSTSEPVRIVNNGGRDSYIFKDNGSFTFEFEDEAGNLGSTKATVNNIDRTPPEVSLVKSYAYGIGGSKSFKTILDTLGNVLLSTGVTLTAEKSLPGSEDFQVVQGKNPAVMLQNDPVKLIVQDRQGNTAALEETIANIAPDLLQPRITQEFVDGTGQPLEAGKRVTINGKTYAKGAVKVTLSGRIDEPNQMFAGAVPVVQGTGYANKISDADGNYAYTVTYRANGNARMVLSDLLGRTVVSAIQVDGLDNTAPEIQLKRPVTAVIRGQKDFEPLRDLGGFTAMDNVSAADKLKVTVSALDLTKTGKQMVTYTITDQVGNTATAKQEVMVMNDSGLLIIGNGQVLSSSLAETVLFDTNRITFSVLGYDKMSVGGKERVNERAAYTLLYHTGLYREGQMKTIAEEIPLQELTANQYQVIFPKTGWYTLIIRTQEREREYVTFFIGGKES